MSKLIHKSRNVNILIYHIVCPAKYRRAVITDEVDKKLKEISSWNYLVKRSFQDKNKQPRSLLLGCLFPLFPEDREIALPSIFTTTTMTFFAGHLEMS
jgi:hypothetical protein